MQALYWRGARLNMEFSIKKALGILFILCFSQITFAYDFSEAIQKISKHDKVMALQSKAYSLEEEGGVRGSWGDPHLKIAAKNFPKETLKNDQTPMTGLEFAVAQKLSLTTKYGNIERGYKQLKAAKVMEAKDQFNTLLKNFWYLLIENQQKKEEIQILEDNLGWVKKSLKVSKKLYANGKVSQQALLDIQIRKSEIEAELINKRFSLKEQQEGFFYLTGLSGDVRSSSIPWRVLKTKSQVQDYKKQLYENQLRAKEHFLTASRLSYIPDLTLSVGYTKRANIDDNGDFLSASISFPLPFSSQKYSQHAQASFERKRADYNLSQYLKYKKTQASQISYKKQKIQSELKILEQKTIKFAENSRKITLRSYSLGRATYIELLKTELKLQNLLFKKAGLKAQLLKLQVLYKYLLGEKLYE